MKKIGLALTIALLLALGATQTKAEGIVISTKSATGIVISTQNGQPTNDQKDQKNIFDLFWNILTSAGIVIST